MEQQKRFLELAILELESVNSLLSCLKNEFDALTNNDIDALNQAVSLKSAEIARTDKLTTQRNQLVKLAGLEVSRKGVDTFILRSDPSIKKELSQTWEKLIATAEACFQQNAVNNGVLVVSQQRAKRSLDILLGQDSSESSAYNTQGKSVQNSNPNKLGTV